jgi:hypothetical protein
MYGLGYGQAGTTAQASSGTSDTGGGTTAGIFNLLSSLVGAGASIYGDVTASQIARDEYRDRRNQNLVIAGMPNANPVPTVAPPPQVITIANPTGGTGGGMPTWGWAAIGVGAAALLGGAFLLKK